MKNEPYRPCDRFVGKKKRVARIIRILEKLFPNAACELKYSTPWELLIAVMLSAQCTDKQVNKVTEKLFQKYRTLEDYAVVSQRALEKDIFSTGFYRLKAQRIRASAKMIKRTYGGRVPSSMQELLTLPGVARKTANVVLGNAFGKADGIAVDTHVKRLSRIAGLTEEKDPNKIERDLMALVPRKEWMRFTYLLISYGRAYCTARKHNHTHCPLTVYCEP